MENPLKNLHFASFTFGACLMVVAMLQLGYRMPPKGVTGDEKDMIKAVETGALMITNYGDEMRFVKFERDGFPLKGKTVTLVSPDK